MAKSNKIVLDIEHDLRSELNSFFSKYMSIYDSLKILREDNLWSDYLYLMEDGNCDFLKIWIEENKEIIKIHERSYFQLKIYEDYVLENKHLIDNSKLENIKNGLFSIKSFNTKDKNLYFYSDKDDSYHIYIFDSHKYHYHHCNNMNESYYYIIQYLLHSKILFKASKFFVKNNNIQKKTPEFYSSQLDMFGGEEKVKCNYSQMSLF